MLAATQPERKYLLGVQQSLSGKAWVQRPVANETHAEFMAGDYDLPPVVARAMLARGVTLDNVEAYLLPSMQDMPDPFSLQDMHEAANIVHSAVDEKKKIAIFADYDVDGNCSGALLVHFFRLLGVEATLYIPDRYREGYGLNVAAIQKLVGDDQHRLLITVDCGSTSVKEVALARQLGADVIILDHHDVGDVLPHANAMVNPKQKHDRSGLNYLCAAGVAFLFAVAARALFRARGQWTSEQQSQLMSMLDVVALATVADMVPLVGFNRVLVSTGLRYMAQTQNLGLQSLADVAKVNLG
ncbi:MAG: single-stranded-DNA-specific exonuclease RecJ, partial [Alphaproteobacteria bacterium]|nr:single-stranded-DNA-specific exonuclease RecJ [Alphaproteobacteria bacterium]NDG05489.1 single-stranded-DNA-specific exonuclease RecJ [Alphaproteobacteria bacterium]